MTTYIKTNGELYHHGIKGMRWGQRNGPPYPLTGKQMSSSERKAGKTGGIFSSKTKNPLQQAAEKFEKRQIRQSTSLHVNSIKTQSIADNVDKQYLQDDISKLLDISKKLVDLDNEMFDVCNKEQHDFFNSNKYKKCMLEEMASLYDSYGYSTNSNKALIDDYYDDDLEECFYNVMTNYENIPKAADLYDKLESCYKDYRNAAKNIADDIIKRSGDKVVSEDVSYSDVVMAQLLRDSGNSVNSYIVRNPDYAWIESKFMSDSYDGSSLKKSRVPFTRDEFLEYYNKRSK